MSSRSSRWRFLSAIALAASLWCAPGRAEPRAEPRLALVVGSAADAAARPSTSSADAGLVAEALSQDGFDVSAVQDADGATLRRAIAAFDDKLRQAGGDAIVFVYLSGTGAQWDGGNFFVPAAARVQHQADVPVHGVALEDIARPIQALPARARLFVYDLARDGPVAKADALPLAAGLALVHAPKGSLYAFNAAPGAIAPPDAPCYGGFARALAEMLRTPGLTTRALFTHVRLRVAQMSAGAVVPWDWSDLDGDPVLLDAGPLSRGAVTDRPIDGLPVEEVFWAAVAEDSLTGYDAFLHAFPDDRLAGRVKAAIAARVEALTWAAAVDANIAPAYWTYMLRYPRAAHYIDVRRRLAAIHAPLAPPPRFDVFEFAGLPTPPAENPSPGDARNGPRDADWAPVPAMPSDFLPSPPGAIYAALPPPPLAPAGALPIPLPLQAFAPLGRSPAQGLIEQPFVPHLGPISIEPGRGDTVMTMTRAAGLVSRTTVEEEKDGRTILQTDAADRIQSRTKTTRAGGLLTIVQTGPLGGILVKVVSTTGVNGERTTRMTNGANQLVAEVQADSHGVETAVTFGTATFGAPLLAISPPESARAPGPKAAPIPPASHPPPKSP